MGTELHLGDLGPAVNKLQPEVDRRRAAATRVSLAVTLALAVAAVMALSGGRALASHVSCGEVITADTTLDSDRGERARPPGQRLRHRCGRRG